MSKNSAFRIKSWVKILAIVVLMLVVFGAGWKTSGVLAQGPTGSEPGANAEQTNGTPPDKRASSSSAAEAGPYVQSEVDASAMQANAAGPVMRAVPSNVEASPYSPSESGGSIAQSNATGTERRPQSLPLVNADPAAPASAYPTHWFTVAGTAFNPSNSSTTYDYDALGCVRPSAAGQWRVMVNLPDGSVLKWIWFITENYSTSSTSSTGWLTRYLWSGTTTDLVYVISDGYSTVGTGIHAKQSTEITSIVDNYNYAYVFVWSGSTTQELCMMQVGYYPPSIFGLALPVVKK